MCSCLNQSHRRLVSRGCYLLFILVIALLGWLVMTFWTLIWLFFGKIRNYPKGLGFLDVRRSWWSLVGLSRRRVRLFMFIRSLLVACRRNGPERSARPWSGVPYVPWRCAHRLIPQWWVCWLSFWHQSHKLVMQICSPWALSTQEPLILLHYYSHSHYLPSHPQPPQSFPATFFSHWL